MYLYKSIKFCITLLHFIKIYLKYNTVNTFRGNKFVISGNNVITCYNKRMDSMNKDISNIIENISADRLSSYKFADNDSTDLILSRYIFNVEVSESFYPILSALEISLRNRLHNAVARLKGNNWLFDEINIQNVLSANERAILLEAYKKLKNRYNTVSTGALITELTFGFWVNLCKKSYKNSLWDKQGFFESVFPDFDKYFSSNALDKTKVIFPVLKDVLRLRNRIFHHEIIINNKNGIENCYSQTKKVLCSLSEDYANMFESSFRFDNIVKQKPQQLH